MIVGAAHGVDVPIGFLDALKADVSCSPCVFYVWVRWISGNCIKASCDLGEFPPEPSKRKQTVAYLQNCEAKNESTRRETGRDNKAFALGCDVIGEMPPAMVRISYIIAVHANAKSVSYSASTRNRVVSAARRHPILALTVSADSDRS